MRLERESGSHVLTLTEMHQRLVNSVYLDRWRDRDTPPGMNALLCKAVVHDSLSRGINIFIKYILVVVYTYFRITCYFFLYVVPLGVIVLVGESIPIWFYIIDLISIVIKHNSVSL